MKCLMCKGNMQEKTTNFMVDLDNCVIIIKNVPSFVCIQCGEVTYDYHVTKQIEKIVNKVKEMVSDVAVFEYSKIAS